VSVEGKGEDVRGVTVRVRVRVRVKVVGVRVLDGSR